MKMIIVLLVVCLSCGAAMGQNVDYHKVNFNIDVKPTLSIDPSIKTFNYKVFLSNATEQGSDEATKNRLVSKLATNLDLKLDPLTLDTTGGDLMIVTVIHRSAFKSIMMYPSNKGFSLTKAVNYYTNVYSKAGTIIMSKHYINEGFSTEFKEAWNSDDIKKNDEYIQRKISTAIINVTLADFRRQISGGNITVESKLADLEAVKKFPELKVMEDQRKELDKLLTSSNKEGFVAKAKEFVPFWESQLSFNASKDSDEVKRAVYQNLALYYLFAGEIEKATNIINLYKPIDKTIKEMFGLVKYRNSDQLEAIVPYFENKVTPLVIAVGEKTYTIDQLVERQRFTIIDGTVVLSGKKGGTFSGKLRFTNPEPGFEAQQSEGGIASLDAADIEFSLLQANGELMFSSVSKVKELKDVEGKNYAVIKTGSALLGGSAYSLLKEVFVSPKISVFKDAFQNTSEFLVKKPGDEKGIKTSMFNTKKNLKVYLADCATVVANIEATGILQKIDIEKIAQEYTNCQ